MTQPSPLYQLIENRIEGTLADFVASRRPATSWRGLAVEIESLTGITLNAETLRLWFIERENGEVPVSTRGAA